MPWRCEKCEAIPANDELDYGDMEDDVDRSQPLQITHGNNCGPVHYKKLTKEQLMALAELIRRS